MKRNKWIRSLLFITFLTLFVHCSNPQEQLKDFAAIPNEKGVSAPFAGFIGDWMIVAGGCNFPTVPAADGGKKVFYSDIYANNVKDLTSSWIKVGTFPLTVAYGASVETDKGLVCIGGSNESSSLTTVFRLEWNDHSKNLKIHQLPCLPETIDNACAVKVGQLIYVTGGNQGKNGQSLYVLHPDKDLAWKKLTSYPGPKRVQPVLLGSEKTKSLYLFGGFDTKTETKQAIISSDFLIYHIDEDSWSVPESIPNMSDGTPRALVGSAGVCVDNLLIVAGGVNYTIFKSAIEGRAPEDYMKRSESWYRFNKDLLIYDTKMKDWRVFTDIEGFNKAGGSLLYKEENLFMVCGEVKPGVRTSKIVVYKLSDLMSK